MTLVHTQCAWTTWIVWLPDHGWPAGQPGERRRQLPLKSRAVGGLHQHCHLWRIVCRLKALVHVYVSPALTQVTQLWEDNALWHKPWWQKTHGAINKRFYFSSMQKTVSVLLHVAGLTSSRGLHICPGAWLGDSPTLCAEGMNILLLVTMPVCITGSMQHPL